MKAGAIPLFLANDKKIATVASSASTTFSHHCIKNSYLKYFAILALQSRSLSCMSD